MAQASQRQRFTRVVTNRECDLFNLGMCKSDFLLSASTATPGSAPRMNDFFLRRPPPEASGEVGCHRCQVFPIEDGVWRPKKQADQPPAPPTPNYKKLQSFAAMHELSSFDRVGLHEQRSLAQFQSSLSLLSHAVETSDKKKPELPLEWCFIRLCSVCRRKNRR